VGWRGVSCRRVIEKCQVFLQKNWCLMNDIIDDAQAWLDAIPERFGITHWDECHTDRHHATCLVRKLIAEAERMRSERLRLTDAERESIEWCLSLPMLDRDAVRMMPLRSLLARLA
jgi:hypothetical protein